MFFGRLPFFPIFLGCFPKKIIGGEQEEINSKERKRTLEKGSMKKDLGTKEKKVAWKCLCLCGGCFVLFMSCNVMSRIQNLKKQFK